MDQNIVVEKGGLQVKKDQIERKIEEIEDGQKEKLAIGLMEF